MTSKTFTTGQIARALGMDKKALRNWITRGHIDPEFGMGKDDEYLWGHGDVSILRGIQPMIASEFPAPTIKAMTERVRALRREGARTEAIVIFTTRTGTREASLNGSVRAMIDEASFGWVLKFPPLGPEPE